MRWMVQGADREWQGKQGTEGRAEALEQLARPDAGRLFAVYRALLAGAAVEEVAARTGMDPWFLAQLQEIVNCQLSIGNCQWGSPELPELLRRAKQMGFADCVAGEDSPSPQPSPTGRGGRSRSA